MGFSNFDPAKLAVFLEYGPLGIGLALAVLTGIVILAQLQRGPHSRNALTLCFGHMAFSLVVMFSGMVFSKLATSVKLLSDTDVNRAFMTGWELGTAQARSDGEMPKVAREDSLGKSLNEALENAIHVSTVSKPLYAEMQQIKKLDLASVTSGKLECLRTWMMNDLQGGRAVDTQKWRLRKSEVIPNEYG